MIVVPTFAFDFILDDLVISDNYAWVSISARNGAPNGEFINAP